MLTAGYCHDFEQAPLISCMLRLPSPRSTTFQIEDRHVLRATFSAYLISWLVGQRYGHVTVPLMRSLRNFDARQARFTITSSIWDPA